MHSQPVSGVRTEIQQSQYRDTRKGSNLGQGIHLGPPSSDFGNIWVRSAPTRVISHVDQEVCDPRCCELGDRSLDINWELGKV